MPETVVTNETEKRPAEPSARPNGKPAVPPVQLESIDVLPEHIALNPKLSALRAGRPITAESVAELAMTIQEEGQQQAALVRPNPNRRTADAQPWELVYGHRRKLAAEKLGATLRCDIRELDDDEALRAALIEGWQREDFSVADRARHVAMLRAEYGWDGPRGTKKIAHHLGVSDSTVTQMDRMAGLPKDVLQKVDDGLMTARAALELAPVKGELRPAVSKRAQELADTAEHESNERRKLLIKSFEKANKVLAPLVAGPARVEGRHIRQAARETKGALARPHAPGKAEIRAWWQAHEGPIYPKVLTAFVTAHIQWLGGGKGKTDKWLEAALEDVADVLAAGTRTADTGNVATKARPSLKVPAKGSRKPRTAPGTKKTSKAAGKGKSSPLARLGAKLEKRDAGKGRTKAAKAKK